jgi:hypothetical protein
VPEFRIDDLNPEQLRAATAGEGPVLTIAGAGTGKTKTLASRVAWLVSQGIDPGRIMLLTFTRRASDEMLRLGVGGKQHHARVISILSFLLLRYRPKRGAENAWLGFKLRVTVARDRKESAEARKLRKQ